MWGAWRWGGEGPGHGNLTMINYRSWCNVLTTRLEVGKNSMWTKWSLKELSEALLRWLKALLTTTRPSFHPSLHAALTTISWLDCDMKQKLGCIWQPSTQWLDWEAQTLPKANLACQHGSWVLSAANLPTTAFWIPGNHYIWEVCSANRDAENCEKPESSVGQRGSNSSVSVFSITISNLQPYSPYGASKGEQTGFDEISYQVLPQDQTHLSLTS